MIFSLIGIAILGVYTNTMQTITNIQTGVVLGFCIKLGNDLSDKVHK
jgi:hypothetical protein